MDFETYSNIDLLNDIEDELEVQGYLVGPFPYPFDLFAYSHKLRTVFISIFTSEPPKETIEDIKKFKIKYADSKEIWIKKGEIIEKRKIE